MRNTDIAAILVIALVVAVRATVWVKFSHETRAKRLLILSTAQLVAVVLAVMAYNLFGGRHAVAITSFAVAAIIALSFMSSGKGARRVLRLGAAIVGCIALSILSWHLRGLILLAYMDSAIVSVRMVVNNEQEFVKAHPEIGFTCQLAQLPPNATIALRAKEWNGYALELVACDTMEPKKPNAKYQVVARPLHQELPAYCSDQSGIVRYDVGGSVEACLRNGTSF